jgi:hypothetical protein
MTRAGAPRPSWTTSAPLQAARKSGSSPRQSLAGWAWFRASTAERFGGTLSFQYGGAGLYLCGAGGITTASVVAFDFGAPVNTIPRHYWASLTGGFLKVRGANRLGGTDNVAAPALGGVLVLAYRTGAAEGLLTEVASAWVNGTTGEQYSADGTALTTVRVSEGVYTATLVSGTYTVAQVTRFTSGDVADDSIAHVWGGKTSSTEVKARVLTSGGAPADADWLVRLWR